MAHGSFVQMDGNRNSSKLLRKFVKVEDLANRMDDDCHSHNGCHATEGKHREMLTHISPPF